MAACSSFGRRGFRRRRFRYRRQSGVAAGGAFICAVGRNRVVLTAAIIRNFDLSVLNAQCDKIHRAFERGNSVRYRIIAVLIDLLRLWLRGFRRFRIVFFTSRQRAGGQNSSKQQRHHFFHVELTSDRIVGAPMRPVGGCAKITKNYTIRQSESQSASVSRTIPAYKKTF